MNFRHPVLSMILLACISCKTSESSASDRGNTIKWSQSLQGDFSFKDQWEYPEGIYKNSFGQLSCDGDCPEGADRMKDATGKIYEDSLQAFYKLVDTTHIAHSLKSETNVYEYFNTNVIEFQQLENGIIRGMSKNNASTHSTLVIEIQGNDYTAWVDYKSIGTSGTLHFPLEKATFQADPKLFEQGVVKAKFDFQFKNMVKPGVPLFWKGLIYAPIEGFSK